LVFLLVLSCAKKENPLSVDHTAGNPSAIGTALPTVVDTDPANKGEITDENGGVSGIQARIKIVFSDYMDETTINSTNVLFYNVMENKYEDVDMEYDAARKTLYLSKAEFQDNCAFVLILKPGITNLAGNPLDGNGNGKADGDPYDRAVFYFYTGTGNGIVNAARITPPVLAYVQPDTGGNVPVNTGFRVRFENGPIDTMTLKSTSWFHVEKTSTGTSVTLDMNIVSNNKDSTVVAFGISGGDTLDSGEEYTITVDAGKLMAFPDTLEALGCTLTTFLKDVDMDGDGLEAEEQNVVVYFITQGIDFPRVHGLVSGDKGDYFYFKFTKKMDVSTFTKENIRVFDSEGYVPGTMRIDLDSMGVEYYYDREVLGEVIGWVSMEVRDTDGNMLDGNGNGIGGEEGKDDWVSGEISGDPYEPNDDPSSAYHISYGTVIYALINPAGDEDWFKFTGNAGDSIEIDIDANTLGSPLDPVLYLYENDGVTVVAWDDDTDGLDSYITCTLPSSGLYYIKIVDYGVPDGGPDYFYHLKLNELAK
ncbi:hypothetical protein DRQ16_00510, partial [bacterium]